MHSSLNELYQKLWEQYTQTSPEIQLIHDSIVNKGNTIVNDHIAFRTFNHKNLGIKNIAAPFIKYGYKEVGQYNFENKKLSAVHFETNNACDPKVFISELQLEKCSEFLTKTVNSLVDQITDEQVKAPQFCYSGPLWEPLTYSTYAQLYEESEYAAWLSAFGFCANHFTVLINELKEFSDNNDLNTFLKSKGFKINSSGGEVKGTKKDFLEQSSTMAKMTPVKFRDQIKNVPSVYYEFAKRYPLKDGSLFQGFVASSADKIFESTNKS